MQRTCKFWINGNCDQKGCIYLHAYQVIVYVRRDVDFDDAKYEVEGECNRLELHYTIHDVVNETFFVDLPGASRKDMLRLCEYSSPNITVETTCVFKAEMSRNARLLLRSIKKKRKKEQDDASAEEELHAVKKKLQDLQIRYDDLFQYMKMRVQDDKAFLDHFIPQ